MLVKTKSVNLQSYKDVTDTGQANREANLESRIIMQRWVKTKLLIVKPRCNYGTTHAGTQPFTIICLLIHSPNCNPDLCSTMANPADWLTDEEFTKRTKQRADSELPGHHRWVAVSKASLEIHTGHPTIQSSTTATAGPEAVENGSVTGNRGTDTLTLMEVGEARGCSSIISGSWYSRELKYSLLYIIIRANFPFWNNVLLTN